MRVNVVAAPVGSGNRARGSGLIPNRPVLPVPICVFGERERLTMFSTPGHQRPPHSIPIPIPMKTRSYPGTIPSHTPQKNTDWPPRLRVKKQRRFGLIVASLRFCAFALKPASLHAAETLGVGRWALVVQFCVAGARHRQARRQGDVSALRLWPDRGTLNAI